MGKHYHTLLHALPDEPGSNLLCSEPRPTVNPVESLGSLRKGNFRWWQHGCAILAAFAFAGCTDTDGGHSLTEATRSNLASIGTAIGRCQEQGIDVCKHQEDERLFRVDSLRDASGKGMIL